MVEKLTDKPMLSVERELLEKVLIACGCYCSNRGFADNLYEEVASLLESKPDPAAQHQCDPVAEVYRGPVSGINRIRWVNSRTQPVGAKLYAEQPAPLKIGSGVTVENIGFGTEHERKPYLVFDGAGCLTEVNLIDVSLVSKRRTYSIPELNEVGVRVEQPAPVPDSRVDNGITYPNGRSRPAYCAAPVAVVMPERQADPGPVAGLTRKWAEGWNDALEAVARLNGEEANARNAEG